MPAKKDQTQTIRPEDTERLADMVASELDHTSLARDARSEKNKGKAQPAKSQRSSRSSKYGSRWGDDKGKGKGRSKGRYNNRARDSSSESSNDSDESTDSSQASSETGVAPIARPIFPSGLATCASATPIGQATTRSACPLRVVLFLRWQMGKATWNIIHNLYQSGYTFGEMARVLEIEVASWPSFDDEASGLFALAEALALKKGKYKRWCEKTNLPMPLPPAKRKAKTAPAKGKAPKQTHKSHRAVSEDDFVMEPPERMEISSEDGEKGKGVVSTPGASGPGTTQPLVPTPSVGSYSLDEKTEARFTFLEGNIKFVNAVVTRSESKLEVNSTPVPLVPRYHGCLGLKT